MAKVNGKKIKIIPSLILMKVNISLIKRTVMVFFPGNLGTFIKVITKMMKEMVMVKCFGQMAQFIKDNGSRVFSMDLGK